MLINWNEVVSHCPNIKGIIHVGAHTGEEAVHYKQIPTIWIDADTDQHNTICEFVRKHQQGGYWQVHTGVAISDHEGDVTFNVTKFKAASSILEPHLNKADRPDIYVTERRVLHCDTLANMIQYDDNEGYEFNFLNLDIQGAELQALKGCDMNLIDYVYTEFNTKEVYKNCSQLHELKAFFDAHGFNIVKQVETNKGWGDLLAVRTKID
jgi:FkbM family methyltransferase